jgi:hypothetical protein
MPLKPDHNYLDFLHRYRNSPNTVAFFVGAGLSQPAFPAWRDVLNRLVDLCCDRGCLTYPQDELRGLIADGKDYVEIAETLVDALDPATFRAFMERMFDRDIDANAVPAAYRDLFGLRPKLVITTNYDRIPNVVAPGTYRVFSHSQAAEALRAIEAGRPTVVKLHGDIQDQISLVLTRRDYQRIIHESPAAKHLSTSLVPDGA